MLIGTAALVAGVAIVLVVHLGWLSFWILPG